jgi:hypothetical protein
MGGRLEEFQRLFAHLRSVSRPLPTLLRLVLSAEEDLETWTRDLLVREQQCCPFFSFRVTAEDDELVVEARVPEGAEPTLDGLAGIAERSQ